MALSIRRKRASRPEVTTAQAPSPPSAPPTQNMSAAAADAAWREKLTAAKPKGRFTQGELVAGTRRR